MTSILSASQIALAAPKGKAGAPSGKALPVGDFAAMMKEASADALPGEGDTAEPASSRIKAGRGEKRKASVGRMRSGIETKTPAGDAPVAREGLDIAPPGRKAEGERSPDAVLTFENAPRPTAPVAPLVEGVVAASQKPSDESAPASASGAALPGKEALGRQPALPSATEPLAPSRGSQADEAETATPAVAPPLSLASQAPDAGSPVQPGEATALLRLLAESLGAQPRDGKTATMPAASVAAPQLAAQASAPAGLLPTSAVPSLPVAPTTPAEQAAATTARAGDGLVSAAVSPSATERPSSAKQGEDSPRRDANARKPSSGLGEARAAAVLPGAPAFATPVPEAARPGGAPATAGTVDVGLSLGQQSLDLHIGGRWIDDLSREIAHVSAQGGHGSFRLATQTLGEMRVELTPGAQGTDVRMLVDNDDAKAALDAASGQLTQDAQLSAVRIGEVRVDRVAASADARGTENQGQQQSQGNQSFSASGQQAGQGQGQSSRQALDAALSQGNGGNGGSQPKASGSSAVNQDTARGEPSTRADGLDDRRARYA